MGKQIAVGAATGLDSIHDTKIIHSDFSQRNVFINWSMVAKVGDFGLAKLADDNGNAKRPFPPSSYNKNRVLITPSDNGAPEIYDADREHRFTSKSDVYSFGYFLLQVLYGKEAVKNAYKVFYLKEAKKDGNFHENVIKKVATHKQRPEPGKNLHLLITQCMHTDANARPNMKTVLLMLRKMKETEFLDNAADPKRMK